ncbi:MAG TPA: GlxA family transcriptional regulator [Pyrinomonadaceae bacterium]|nr:GlxA family transcriptional regulator [Pyrinomonadaceae bacterium]
MPKPKSNASLVKGRRIVIVVVPPIEEMDLVAPLQVFGAANRLSERKVYSLEIATNGKALEVPGEGGMLCFLAQQRIHEVKGSIDSVLLVCGVGTRLLRDRELSQWLKTIAPEVRRLGGVCVGSFLLAEAGLLNNKKATSHWRFGKELAQRYPQVQVESEPIWVRDGNIYTSAGISAGIDLALAWVEEDCGSALAHEVAREFVLFLRRPGGQEQLSVSLAKQASDMRSIQELQVWIADHVEANLSVQALAERVAMSVRNFERVFTREIGCTPARYVAQVRVEAARRALEDTDKSIEQIARNCGFVNADLMRRAFTRCIGITPARYRTDRFSRKVAKAQRKPLETR